MIAVARLSWVNSNAHAGSHIDRAAFDDDGFPKFPKDFSRDRRGMMETMNAFDQKRQSMLG